MIAHEPSPPPPPAADPWPRLRALTPARIGLGRRGVSLPTGAHLRFQLAHAQARDAVHGALDAPGLLAELATRGHATLPQPLHSAASDRQTYLQRPDLGRRLDEPSARLLAEHAVARPDGYDAAIVIADGLSALAVERHAPPLLDVLLPDLRRAGWRLAPLAVVEQGRVAVADEVGALLGARLVVIVLGERPGLSAPDSLGAYLTHAPRVGAADAERNCVSNIRAAGLGYAAAAGTLLYLMREALRREASGVALKDETEQLPAIGARVGRNFLVEGDCSRAGSPRSPGG